VAFRDSSQQYRRISKQVYKGKKNHDDPKDEHDQPP
jgi:hypothetical protein